MVKGSHSKRVTWMRASCVRPGDLEDNRHGRRLGVVFADLGREVIGAGESGDLELPTFERDDFNARRRQRRAGGSREAGGDTGAPGGRTVVLVAPL